MIKDYFLDQALKQGWIQIGPGIPVFMKHLPDNKYIDDYSFLIVNTVDPKVYYHMYNDWVNEGRIKAEDINPSRVFGAAFNHYRAKPAQLAVVTAIAIEDHYRNEDRANYKAPGEQCHYYCDIVSHLIQKSKEDVTAENVQREICDQPVSDKGLEG